MPGRHRRPRRSPAVRATAWAAAFVVFAAGGWFGLRELTGAGCDRQVRLTVAAATEIAPAVEATADAWIDDGPVVDGACVVAVEVAGAEPVEVAAAVAWQHGLDLTGVGRAAGSTAVPDVWIPDSSIWLSRLRAAAAGFTPPSVASIARSPVVLAVPEPVATELEWPDTTLTWSQVADQLRTGTRLRTGIVEPTRDAAGLSGLLALGRAVTASGGQQEATAGALRALAQDRSALREDLLARFPRSEDSATVASAVTAAPLSEQAVIAYNRARPPIDLAAVYVEPAPAALDYPMAVMPGGTPDQVRAADALRALLDEGPFLDRLAAAGLRGPDGVAGAGFAAPIGAPRRAGAPPASPGQVGQQSPDSAGQAGRPSPQAPDPSGSASPDDTDQAGVPRPGLDVATVERTLSAWTAITLPARMLAVVDVSGSMLQRVPSAGNRTRAQVTAEAARRGLELFDDSWAVGLWAFSTELSGGRDWRPVVPIGPLSANRSDLAGGLDGLRPKDGGGTGLYDTLLEAYREVQTGWDPDRVNSVVMLTDGENEDDNGIGLDELLAELKDMKDDRRPIQVVVIGIGPDVGPDNLSRITAVTGGGVFIAEDPSKIDQIFLKAISLRTRVRQPGVVTAPS